MVALGVVEMVMTVVEEAEDGWKLDPVLKKVVLSVGDRVVERVDSGDDVLETVLKEVLEEVLDAVLKDVLMDGSVEYVGVVRTVVDVQKTSSISLGQSAVPSHHSGTGMHTSVPSQITSSSLQYSQVQEQLFAALGGKG